MSLKIGWAKARDRFVLVKIVDSKNKRCFYLIFPSKWCVYMEYQTVNYIKRSGWMNYNRLACSTLKTRYETFTENGILPANAHIHTNTHIQTVTHSCYIFIARDTHIWCYLFGMSDVKSDQTGVRFALMHPLIYTAGSKWSTSLLAANFGQAEKLFISSIGHANPSWVSNNHFLTLSVFSFV